MKNGEEADIVTSDEEPDEEEMYAKKKQEYVEELKRSGKWHLENLSLGVENDEETTEVAEKWRMNRTKG